MSLKAENHRAEEFTEDALARRVYHLNTLYELSKFKYKPLIFDFIKVSIGAGLVI